MVRWLNEPRFGRTVGQLDRQLVGRTVGRTVEQTVRRTVGRTVIRTVRQTVGRTVGWKVRQTVGRTVGRSDRRQAVASRWPVRWVGRLSTRRVPTVSLRSKFSLTSYSMNDQITVTWPCNTSGFKISWKSRTPVCRLPERPHITSGVRRSSGSANGIAAYELEHDVSLVCRNDEGI